MLIAWCFVSSFRGSGNLLRFFHWTICLPLDLHKVEDVAASKQSCQLLFVDFAFRLVSFLALVFLNVNQVTRVIAMVLVVFSSYGDSVPHINSFQ